ncbi:histidinol-phosphate transaminase [Nakamurella aerolata]|uniref:Aromatic amino acid aminotransferase n=1 Tax=Nakamurella aerolata TaxID=1656892 RepID=A0A849ABB7_9ACTN|nr:histidinol-phosphate transaminase [Nakamurella aerolata]
MSVQLRSALAELPAYAPGRNVPGAIKLASNELSFPPLPAVADAIAGAVADSSATAQSGVNRYPDNGAAALLQKLSEATGVPTGNLIAGCGSVALCQQLVQIVAGAEDALPQPDSPDPQLPEVVFGWRSFEAYPIVTQIAGATPVRVPLTADHQLDLDAMAQAVTPATRLIFLCSPNNPTGTALSAPAVEAFLDSVPSDVLVVLDEAYREFNRADNVPDGAALALARPNVVALRTLSKAYGLAGLRVGYAIAAPDVIAALSKVAIPFALNTLAQAAAVAALGQCDELQPRWDEVVAERKRVTDALLAQGYQVPPSQANFVWLPLEDDSARFSAHCEQAGVTVRGFSHANGGGVRVTIGRPDENDAFLTAAASFDRKER